VKDCEKAAAWWQRVFGVGPCSTDTYVLDESTKFRFKGEPGGRSFRVKEVYLNSPEYIGGSTVQLIEIVPL
jgi:hypothetical protein